jgi:hypothetical protein
MNLLFNIDLPESPEQYKESLEILAGKPLFLSKTVPLHCQTPCQKRVSPKAIVELISIN